MKIRKKLLRDNTGHGGSLVTNKFMRAVLQYRNTTMQDCRRSRAQIGRQMRDFIPSLTYKYKPAKDWAVTQEHRERTLANKREMENPRWSHRTKALDDLEVGTAFAIQNQTGNNPTKWDKAVIIIENKPNRKVMIRVDRSRCVTIRNRRFVRPMEPMLKNDTRPEPVRRRTAQQPPIRQELPRKNLPSRSLVQVEHVDKAPADVRGGEPDVRFKKVQDTEDVHRQVDAWQDGKAIDDHDDAPTGGHDDRDQEILFEDVTEVQEPNGGSTRPKRSPNPKYSSDDYDLNYVVSKLRTRSRRSIRRAGHSSR
jgi:hypothetical protein